MLIAGRMPNTKRLNLEAVGVELDKTGAVKVTLPFFPYFSFPSIGYRGAISTWAVCHWQRNFFFLMRLLFVP